MRNLRSTLIAACVAFGASPALADITADMQNISRFCSQYVQAGQITNVLLQNGFEERRGEFRKSYNASFIGGTQPVINVDPRQARSGLSCSASFGIVDRGAGGRLMATARESLIGLGYREGAVANQRGQQTPAFILDGVAVQLGGSTQYQNSTYTAVIYFQRLN